MSRTARAEELILQHPAVLTHRESRFVLRRCGRKGHVVAYIDDPVFTDMSALNSSGLVLRCLRCGTFVPPQDPAVTVTVGSEHQPEPLSNVPVAVRGSHGRKLALLKIVAAELMIRSVGLVLLAGGSFVLASKHSDALQKFQDVSGAAQPLGLALGFDVSRFRLIRQAETALSHTDLTYVVVGLIILLYATMLFTEGFGLWRGARWAEYMTVITTAFFIPFEVYSLLLKPQAWKALVLAFNIALVVYLLHKGRLFGLRGGRPAWLAEVRETTLLADVLHERGRSSTELQGRQFV